MRGLAPEFSTKLVGVTYSPWYPRNVWALEHRLRYIEVRTAGPPRPVPVVLRREPDNPVDRNAVAVVVEEEADLGHLGHLNATLSARLAPELDNGTSWSAQVINIAIHPQRETVPGIEVRLTRGPA